MNNNCMINTITIDWQVLVLVRVCLYSLIFIIQNQFNVYFFSVACSNKTKKNRFSIIDNQNNCYLGLFVIWRRSKKKSCFISFFHNSFWNTGHYILLIQNKSSFVFFVHLNLIQNQIKWKKISNLLFKYARILYQFLSSTSTSLLVKEITEFWWIFWVLFFFFWQKFKFKYLHRKKFSMLTLVIFFCFSFLF